MLRELLGPWSFETNPLWIALVIGALVFYSMAISYAQSRGKDGTQTLGLGLIFILVGDAILFALWNAMGWPQTHQFQNVAIYSYGFMLMIAFIASTILLVNRGKREDWAIPSDTVLDLMTFIIIGGIVGARVLYVALEWDTQYGPNASGVDYATAAEAWKAALLNVAKINEGGLSFHGGILGALLFGFFYTAARKLNFLKMVDFVAPAVPIGGFFGRLGCFLNGCCYGIATGTMPGIEMKVLGDGIARHPAQLYEAGGHLLIFAWLAATEKSAKFPGHLFLRFIVGYSWVRFVVEWFRFDETAEKLAELPGLGWITVAQAASLVVIILGSLLIWFMTRMAEPGEDEGEGGIKGDVIAPGKLIARDPNAIAAASKPAAAPKIEEPAGPSPAPTPQG